MWSCCCAHNVIVDPNKIVCLGYVRDSSAPNVYDRRSHLTWLQRILSYPLVDHITSTILEYFKFDKYGEVYQGLEPSINTCSPFLCGVNLWGGGALKIGGQDMMILSCASCWYWCGLIGNWENLKLPWLQYNTPCSSPFVVATESMYPYRGHCPNIIWTIGSN